MSVHPRTQIRQQVVAQLLGKTAAADRVYPTRVVSGRQLRDLPILAVYTIEDEVDEDSRRTAPRRLLRTTALVVEGYIDAAAGTPIDDQLDALELEVMTALHPDPFFGFDWVNDSLLGSAQLEVIEDGNRLIGFLQMPYAVDYWMAAPEPPATLDDFLTAGATHNLGGDVHQDEDAEDVFTVQEAP